MGLKAISPGNKAPDEFNVVIEIPMHGSPIKYEVNKESGALFVDRFLNTAMYYPFNYGYVPQTLSLDGDPADVLVMTPIPLTMGTVITVRPIGMLVMSDESGEDTKILAVPISKLTKIYDNIHTHEDVSEHILATVQHFFEHYKDLEKGKWVKVGGWKGPEEAKQEIRDSIARYVS